MRLIDADKLERQYIGYRSGRQELVIKADKVDNAPTVEAIPIEWLKEFYKNTSVSIPVGVPMIKILEELESAYKAMAERGQSNDNGNKSNCIL